jgi:uncharacterized protein YndB with AHSA1/START domain
MTRRPVARVLAAGALLVPCFTSCFGPTRAEDPLPGAVQEAAVIADDDSMRHVLATAYLPVPPWEAWDWVASDDRLEAWLARDVTLDAFVGGPVRLAADIGEANGSVTALDEPRSMTWLFDDQLKPDGTTTRRAVSFTVTEEIGGSRIHIQEGPFDATQAGERLAVAHRQRWTESMRILRAAVMRRLPTVPQEELPLEAAVPKQEPAPTPSTKPATTPSTPPTPTLPPPDK